MTWSCEMILQVSVVCKMDVDAMKSVMVLLEDTRRVKREEVRSSPQLGNPNQRRASRAIFSGQIS